MKTFVSKIYLPEKEKFKAYVDKIYDSGWVTNNGPLVQELEKRLEDYLGVKNVLVTSSGTAALFIAMKTIDLEGEVITTPFTYVATASAICSEKVRPVFVDIDPQTLNIDPDKIEAAITPQTRAILPVHVFGNPCDIEAIQKIAEKHKLRVIYDAAHAFGVDYNGKSIFSYGDVSAVSFHATKIYNTIEGGAVVVKDDALYEKAKALRTFGVDSDGELQWAGINGRLNEFCAAMGILNLDHIDDIVKERERAYNYYREHLDGKVEFQKYSPNGTMNYSYISVLFKNWDEMDAVRSALAEQEIYPRQYFYPSLETAKYTGATEPMPVSSNVVSRILVLPMHSGAEKPITETILSIVDR